MILKNLKLYILWNWLNFNISLYINFYEKIKKSKGVNLYCTIDPSMSLTVMFLAFCLIKETDSQPASVGLNSADVDRVTSSHFKARVTGSNVQI